MKTFKYLFVIISLFVIIAIFESCAQSSGKEYSGESDHTFNEEFVSYDSYSINTHKHDTIEISQYDTVDTFQNIFLAKKIEAIFIDTAIQINTSKEFKKLEKTEKVLDEQTRIIDSLINAKRK